LEDSYSFLLAIACRFSLISSPPHCTMLSSRSLLIAALVASLALLAIADIQDVSRRTCLRRRLDWLGNGAYEYVCHLQPSPSLLTFLTRSICRSTQQGHAGQRLLVLVGCSIHLCQLAHRTKQHHSGDDSGLGWQIVGKKHPQPRLRFLEPLPDHWQRPCF
jgi:hypothetical protein